MNQKYIISGILILGLLLSISAALSVTGNMSNISIFDNGSNGFYHDMHNSDHDDSSGHHGMMHGDNHGVDECDEYDIHLEEGIDCDNHDYDDYCNHTAINIGC
jgi:hypothetical protein